MTIPLTLLESVDLLGRYRYVELACFGAIGGRVISAEMPNVQRFLAGASLAHGWRARLVEEHLPITVGLPGSDACTRSPSPSVDQAIACSVERGSDGAVLDGLIRGLYPAMAAAYRERIAAASPAPDGPLVRTLMRIVADINVVIADGGALLGDWEGGDCSDRIIALVAEAGGPFGPLVDHRLPGGHTPPALGA